MDGTPLDALVELLELEQLERDYFRGYSPQGGFPDRPPREMPPGPDRARRERGRIFGGQVLGQALMAAGRTVPDRAAGRPVHSLQAYFLLAGDPSVPILFEVDRIRDGRSFTTRRVRAMQHGEAIFALSASFHVPEDGPDHQEPMPEVTDIDELPEADDSSPWRFFGRMGAVTMRYVEPRDPGRPMSDPVQKLWVKADGRLPDDPLLHACLVSYASDMGLVSTIATRHSAEPWSTRHMMASLDHAMWFHRQFRADEWFLYSRTSPSAHGARGLAHGHMYTRDGALGVTIVQEGLVRPIRPREP